MNAKQERICAKANSKLMRLTRPAIDGALADLLPGGKASIEPATDSDGYPTTVLVTVPLACFELRLSIDVSYAIRDTPVEPLLRARLAEAIRQQDRFAARLDDARERTIASLARNGGMEMDDLGMERLPLCAPFEWDYVRLVVRFATLDDDLKPTIECVKSHSARGIAGGLRVYGALHLKRLARRRRLDEQDAVAEIDLEAEAYIARRGWSLKEVVEALRDWRTSEDARRYFGAGLGYEDARIYLHGSISRRMPMRPVRRSELEAGVGAA